MEAYQRLESEWAKFNDLDPAGMVCCSSGTAALHLALESLQLPPASRVLVPDFTMVACARAVTLAGLEPVFVDCDERLLMDLDLWTKAVTEKTAAIMFVHIYGRRCEFPQAWDKYGATLKIVEDLAEAHGIKPHPSTDAAAWSFFKNKCIAGEEGGAVWFRDREHAELARSLRCLGFDSRHDFNHRPRGHNYRMSNVHAHEILGDARTIYPDTSLAAYKRNLELRKSIENQYNDWCPSPWRMLPRDVPWVYDIRIPGLTSVKQDEIVYSLNREGIAARHAFKPMSMQEEYRRCKVVSSNVEATVGFHAAGTRAAIAAREVLYLPIQPGVTTEQQVGRSFEVIQSLLSR